MVRMEMGRGGEMEDLLSLLRMETIHTGEVGGGEMDEGQAGERMGLEEQPRKMGSVGDRLMGSGNPLLTIMINMVHPPLPSLPPVRPIRVQPATADDRTLIRAVRCRGRLLVAKQDGRMLGT